MKVTVKVPPLPADAGEEVVLTQWLVDVSEQVEQGQSLAVLELAKTSTEIPSPAGGTVAQLLCAIDQDVTSGQPLCVIDTG